MLEDRKMITSSAVSIIQSLIPLWSPTYKLTVTPVLMKVMKMKYMKVGRREKWPEKVRREKSG